MFTIHTDYHSEVVIVYAGIFQSIPLGCLSGYIDVTQIVLVILTMVGLFLNRPHILSSYIPITLAYEILTINK